MPVALMDYAYIAVDGCVAWFARWIATSLRDSQ